MKKKAKKNIVHAMRWLHFGLQIIENNKIVDYTDGNQHWDFVSFLRERRKEREEWTSDKKK